MGPGYIDMPVTSTRYGRSLTTMRGDVDLKEIKKLRFSGRTRQITIAVVVLAVVNLAAWRYLTHPPKPWLVRWKLDRYLKGQSHANNFKVDFPFPSKAEMVAPKAKPAGEAAKLKGSRTGKDFDSLREEYMSLKSASLRLERGVVQSETELKESAPKVETLTRQLTEAQAATDAVEKVTGLQSNLNSLRVQMAAAEKVAARRPELQSQEQALAPIVDDLWEFQRSMNVEGTGSASALAEARDKLTRISEEKLSAASSYEGMYRVIGEELFVAKGLLASGNPEHRKIGVNLAFTASRHALGYAMNGAVAARICEGYILPNMDLATEANRRSTFHEQTFVEQCANIFQRNNEYNNVVMTYQRALDNAKNPAQADWARSQMAMAYEQGGQPKQAVAMIQEIKDTNSYRGLIRRLPRLKQDAGMAK